MPAASKFLLLLLIVGGLAYGYQLYTEIHAAEEALRETNVNLTNFKGQLEMKRTMWGEIGEIGRQHFAATEKNQVLLKARSILDERLNKVNAELKQAADSLQTAVEKARTNAVGAELGDLTLTSGKVLHGVKIRKFEDTGISLMFAEGAGTAPVDLLPESLKEKYDLGGNAILPKLTAARTTLRVPAREPDTLNGSSSAAVAQTSASMSQGGAVVLDNHATTQPTTPSAPAAPASGNATTAAGSSFDSNCLVIIKTDNACGSGFIAQVNGKTYVYTNAHVICGSPRGFTTKITSIKTTSGRVIPTPYELELSNTYDPNAPNGLEDVARFPVTLKEGETAYAIPETDFPVTVHQPVIAYGNSLGGDVVTSLAGQILGLGTDRIEVSCEIVPGNSGGPIVLTDTKQVLGISTYLNSGQRDIWSSGTTFDGIRRFAVRPNKVTSWRKMQYASLMSSLAELKAFDRDTLSLAAACFLNPKPNRGGFDVPSVRQGDYIIKQVLMDGSKHALGATINGGIAKVNQRLGAAKSTMSMITVVPVFAEFFSLVSQTSSAQMASLSFADKAPYLKQFIPEMVEIRKVIQTRFINEGAERYR